jgi:hypothetical protein
MTQQASPRPGWYPDTMSSVPLLRYWDGVAWTSRTQLPAAPGPPAPPSSPVPGQAPDPAQPAPKKRRWMAVKWGAVATFVLAAAVVGITLARGQQVCSVNTSGEFIFATRGEECVSKDQLADAQESLRADVAAPKADVVEEPVPGVLPDLNGQWSAAGGITYVITQGGSDATIEEYTPGLGLTATGVGTVTEEGAQFQFTAYNGTTGFGVYALQGPDVLVGTVTNTSLNWTMPVVLTRTG